VNTFCVDAKTSASIFYCGVRLDRATPRVGEIKRFEASQFGSHFPLQIWVALVESDRWHASFEIGPASWGDTPEEALDNARTKAIGYLYRQAERLEYLGS
jgi:hypothetical protein